MYVRMYRFFYDCVTISQLIHSLKQDRCVLYRLLDLYINGIEIKK